MASFSQVVTVNWGESDPFGLVYYAREVAWFNDVEHELFREMGFPIDQMIRRDRTAFVMGEINFRFVGPAAYGDKVHCTIRLSRIGRKTLHWDYIATNLRSGDRVAEGSGTRIYAQIQDDGNLSSKEIPDDIRNALSAFDESKQ